MRKSVRQEQREPGGDGGIEKKDKGSLREREVEAELESDRESA